MIYKYLTLFLLFSCSIFIEKYEKDLFEENNIFPKKEIEQIMCKKSSGFSLISENTQAQIDFRGFINNAKIKLSFIDQVVLWSLLQMNLRPDQSAPTAKLQVLVKINGKENYFNSYSDKQGSTPYLNLLAHLLKEYKSRHTLYSLAKYLDKNYNGKLLVTKDFELFLSQNKGKIQTSKTLKSYYMRGDETLKSNERISKTSFATLVSSYQKSKRKTPYSLTQLLFTHQLPNDEQIKCNFDMGLYENSLFLINKTQIKSNIFGLKAGTNAFMAASSQEIKNYAPFKSTLFFKGNSQIRSASVCSYSSKNRKRYNDLWLFSSESRDPGQHLYHLLQYEVTKTNEPAQLRSMLSFSRHQFLKDPVRLIIESRRSGEKQVEELLRLNVPIYNSKSIGRIWGLFNRNQGSSFFLDERREGHLLCN